MLERGREIETDDSYLVKRENERMNAESEESFTERHEELRKEQCCVVSRLTWPGFMLCE
jgi:hypothetical protein